MNENLCGCGCAQDGVERVNHLAGSAQALLQIPTWLNSIYDELDRTKKERDEAVERADAAEKRLTERLKRCDAAEMVLMNDVAKLTRRVAALRHYSSCDDYCIPDEGSYE